MGRALIIGCGGVASVAIQKCCQNSEVFEEIMIASRTKSKCDALKDSTGIYYEVFEGLSNGQDVEMLAQYLIDSINEVYASNPY